ncbi:hypothetical protein D3C81_1598550 [compost metagenome]
MIPEDVLHQSLARDQVLVAELDHLMALYHVVLLPMTDQMVEQGLRTVSQQEADIQMVAEHGHRIDLMELTQACGTPMELQEPAQVPVMFLVQ